MKWWVKLLLWLWPHQLRALWLQSGSISLLTFLVSPLLFCQPCIISCFEPSPGCEGNGEIPVWLCYLVAGDGKLCWSCCRADVSEELQWFCRKALHCTGPVCIPCTPLRASQSLWMNSLCQNVTRTIVFALNQAHLWRGGKSLRRKHSQPPWSLPTTYFFHIFQLFFMLTTRWSNDCLVTIVMDSVGSINVK